MYQTHATDSKRLPTVVFGVKVPPFQSISKCKLGNTSKLHINSIELESIGWSFRTVIKGDPNANLA